jgi:hypothetical protein
MATSAWERVRQDTLCRIIGSSDLSLSPITPTFDAGQPWRSPERPRKEGDGGRDRELQARRWTPRGGVRVFGGGESQLSRDLQLEVWYQDSPDFEDRRACDEVDLVAALEPRSTYPSGTWGALYVRQVIREEIATDEPKAGAIKVTYPIRLVWREPTTLV